MSVNMSILGLDYIERINNIVNWNKIIVYR